MPYVLTDERASWKESSVLAASYHIDDTYGRAIITAPRDTVLTIIDGIADALESEDTARAFDLLEYLRDTIASEV